MFPASLSDELAQVLPVGMRKQGQYFGQGTVAFRDQLVAQVFQLVELPGVCGVLVIAGSHCLVQRYGIHVLQQFPDVLQLPLAGIVRGDAFGGPNGVKQCLRKQLAQGIVTELKQLHTEFFQLFHITLAL